MCTLYLSREFLSSLRARDKRRAEYNFLDFIRTRSSSPFGGENRRFIEIELFASGNSDFVVY